MRNLLRSLWQNRRQRRAAIERRDCIRSWPVVAQVFEERTLLSAPAFDWGFSLGTTGGQATVNSTAVDSSGDVYVAGVVTSGTVDLDPGSGTHNVTADNQTGFVVKYDSSGNFVWAETFASDETLTSFSLAVDATTGVYVVGGFRGTATFGVGESNPATLTNQGGTNSNGFVAKLDQTTGEVDWVDGILGTMALATNNVAVDATGNVYIAGQSGASGTVTIVNGQTGSTITSFSNTASNYVAKLSTTGGVTWAEGFAEGKATVTPGGGLGVDGSGNVYLLSTLSGKDVDFDPGSGTFELSRSAFPSNTVVTKLDTDGAFVWATKDDSSHGKGTSGSSIAVDASGNAYITMQQSSSWWCWPWQGGSRGKQQLAKIDADGNWEWTQTLERTRPGHSAGPCGPAWDSNAGWHDSTPLWSPSACDDEAPIPDHNSGSGSSTPARSQQVVSSTTAKVALNSAGNPIVVSAGSGATEYDSSGTKVWTTTTPLPVTDVATGPSGAIVFVGMFRGEMNVDPTGTFTLDANTSWWQQAPFVVQWTES